MSSYDFNFGSFVISLLITILAYMIVPVVLRLSRKKPYNKKDANRISIINSIIIAIIFYILRDMSGEIENNAISIAPAFLYYGLNLSLLQWKLKDRDYTYLFMILSIISSITGWFVGALLFGFVGFMFAFGGLRLAIYKWSYERIALYIEAFLGLFIFFTYFHSITFDIGIKFIWGAVYALVTMIILYFTIFKKEEVDVCYGQILDNEEVIEERKIRYCKICGGKLNQNKKCKKCGKQYFKFSYKLLSIILGVIIVVLIGACIYIYSLYDKGVELYAEYLVDDIFEENSYKDELDSLNGYRSTSWTKNKLDFFDENIVFVIDGYGDYYYTYDCMVDSLDEDYTYWAFNKEQAIYKGYKEGSCN